MLKDFRAFIVRGNVLDLAVAVIIGAAFGQIVSSLVNDIIMPPVGLLLGNVDFSSLYLNLSPTQYPTFADALAAGAPTINYGAFISTVIDFLIVSGMIFLIVRAVQRLESLRAAESTSNDQGLPPLHFDNPSQGNQVPLLHLATLGSHAAPNNSMEPSPLRFAKQPGRARDLRPIPASRVFGFGAITSPGLAGRLTHRVLRKS